MRVKEGRKIAKGKKNTNNNEMVKYEPGTRFPRVIWRITDNSIPPDPSDRVKEGAPNVANAAARGLRLVAAVREKRWRQK
jgi:hypothetical protein